MNKKSIVSGIISSICLLNVSAATVTFHGVASRELSNPKNWDTFPAAGDYINISTRSASADKPALIDPAFKVKTGFFRVYSNSESGVGPAYATLQNGTKLFALGVYAGNEKNPAFTGHLRLETGSSIQTSYPNSGEFSIGHDQPRAVSTVVVENGVKPFEHARMILRASGKLTFLSGANSVSTFVSMRRSEASENILDGLVQVDLAALKQGGEYKLIDGGASTVSIGGALRKALDSAGGTLHGTGDYSSKNFSVLNGGAWKWTLQLKDSGKTLVLTAS